MKPQTLARNLRLIASKIEASAKPDKRLVIADIRHQIRMASDAYPFEDEVMSGSDGPVTPFVALQRTCDLIAAGKVSAVDGANFISDLPFFSGVDWDEVSGPTEDYTT